jgi:hypothetical protein
LRQLHLLRSCDVREQAEEAVRSGRRRDREGEEPFDKLCNAAIVQRIVPRVASDEMQRVYTIERQLRTTVLGLSLPSAAQLIHICAVGPRHVTAACILPESAGGAVGGLVACGLHVGCMWVACGLHVGCMWVAAVLHAF